MTNLETINLHKDSPNNNQDKPSAPKTIRNVIEQSIIAFNPEQPREYKKVRQKLEQIKRKMTDSQQGPTNHDIDRELKNQRIERQQMITELTARRKKILDTLPNNTNPALITGTKQISIFQRLTSKLSKTKTATLQIIEEAKKIEEEINKLELQLRKIK